MTTVGSLHIAIDSSALQAQYAELKRLLHLIPKRAAKRIARKAQRLVRVGFRWRNAPAGPERAKVTDDAAKACNGRIVGSIAAEVVGLDELIAATARRAEKCKRA